MEREDVERMMDYIAHNGALHEYPECPEDDTCDCKFRDTNASVTVCCQFLHEAPARITALETALARVEREHTLLSAECEAWRAADLRHDWIRDNTAGGVAATHEVDCLICKMNATDAANILKGAE